MFFNEVFIYGAGYVGFSLSMVLSSRNDITLVDINEERLEKVRKKIEKCRKNQKRTDSIQLPRKVGEKHEWGRKSWKRPESI